MTDLQSELEKMIHERDLHALRRGLEGWSRAQLAGLIAGLAVKEQVIVFRTRPRRLAAHVFECPDAGARSGC